MKIVQPIEVLTGTDNKLTFNPRTCEANIRTLNVKSFGVIQLVFDLFKPKYKPAMKEILENKICGVVEEKLLEYASKGDFHDHVTNLVMG